MHEMGIAASVIEALQKEMFRHPGGRASRVGLRIGAMAGVDAESLRFCFDVIVRETDLEPLALSIEVTPGDELDFAWIEIDEPGTLIC